MHAQQPERAELLGHLLGEGALVEPVAHVGDDAVIHELADGVADQPLLVAELGADRQEVVRVAFAAAVPGGVGLAAHGRKYAAGAAGGPKPSG